MEKNIFKQTWWSQNLSTKMNEFCSWIGNYDAESKVFCRRYVAFKQHKTLLDAGCGVCTEYFGYKQDGYDLQYKGVDATPELVDLAKQQGIDVVNGYLESLPFEDNSFDVVYIRHILEHLPSYTEALNEAIRVGSKEVMVVWFIKPDLNQDKIDYDPKENLYHNRYNRPLLESFVQSNHKVKEFEWVEVNDKEEVLLISLKEASQ